MNNMQVFENERFGNVRVTTVDNEPWFVAADVCKALEIEPTATRRLDDDEKNTLRLTQGTSGNPNVTIVNESGLYSLVLGSRKPEAKAFKRWVTHDVIPAIRKHGVYMTPDALEKALLSPDYLLKVVTVLKNETDKRKALEKKVEQDKPKVILADAITESDDSVLVKTLATILKQNGYDIGQNRLFEQLRNEGFLVSRAGNSRNLPTQKSMDMGLFEVRESVIYSGRDTKVVQTPYVTGKGQIYFVNKYCGHPPVKELAEE
nr:MAG TPA: repressor domain protein [Caudoviricetes sp.]